MKFKKKDIFVKIIVLFICFSGIILSGVFFGASLHTYGGLGKGTIIPAIMFPFSAVLAWVHCNDFVCKIKEYNGSKKLLDEVKNINPFASDEEMKVVFEKQKQRKIYEDDDFILTESFLFYIHDKQLFFIDGILDVRVFVQKTNFTIEYATLSILYCDGEKYEFKFRRSLERFICGMKERVSRIERIARLVATKSKNFNKYSDFKL